MEKLNQKTKTYLRTATGIFLIFLITCIPLKAQALKPLFDGRLNLSPTPLTPEEQKLITEKVFPEAAKFWRARKEGNICEEEGNAVAVDIAKGAFTRPGAGQKAVLYRFCVTGHNFARNGIAIIENGKIVCHIAYNRCWENAIGAFPDINGNGLSEIVVAFGGTNQGITYKGVSIIEISGKNIFKFGGMQVYEDNYGASENGGKAEASKLLVKPGKNPAFFREIFSDGGTNSWKKGGAARQAALTRDETEYWFVK